MSSFLNIIHRSSTSLILILLAHFSFSQSERMKVFYPEDTLTFDLIYKDLDSLENEKLEAYYKENPEQIAYVKNYYYGKQSGIYKAFYPSGRIMIFAVYQRGMLNGDYTWFSPDGKVLIKAQYRDNIRHGYYANRLHHFQGRFRDGKRHGKWEFNVGSSAYRKAYYSEGKLTSKPSLMDRAKDMVSDLIPEKREDSTQTSSNIQGDYYDQYDTLYLKSKESDSLKPYAIYYLPYDSLLHPSLRKAVYVEKQEQTAVVKYIIEGQLNGLYQLFYPNGNIYQYGHYDYGKKDGSWKEYDPYGQLRQRGNYRSGKKHGRWMYDIGTEQYHKVKYKDGVAK